MPKIPLAALIAQNPNDGDRINFFTWFYSHFDNAMAAHQTITNVEPLYFQGAIAGTEFLTYANTKLYICLSMESSDAGLNASQSALLLKDEADADMLKFFNLAPVYDAVSVKYFSNDIVKKDLYFSRVIVTNYTKFVFNGYRITLN
jgi:hypothetical protein